MIVSLRLADALRDFFEKSDVAAVLAGISRAKLTLTGICWLLMTC